MPGRTFFIRLNMDALAAELDVLRPDQHAEWLAGFRAGARGRVPEGWDGARLAGADFGLACFREAEVYRETRAVGGRARQAQQKSAHAQHMLTPCSGDAQHMLTPCSDDAARQISGSAMPLHADARNAEKSPAYAQHMLSIRPADAQHQPQPSNNQHPSSNKTSSSSSHASAMQPHAGAMQPHAGIPQAAAAAAPLHEGSQPAAQASSHAEDLFADAPQEGGRADNAPDRRKRDPSPADLTILFPALLVYPEDRQPMAVALALYGADSVMECLRRLSAEASKRPKGKHRILVGELSERLRRTVALAAEDYQRAGLPAPPGTPTQHELNQMTQSQVTEMLRHA